MSSKKILEELSRTAELGSSRINPKRRASKLSFELDIAKNNYERLTSMTKQQQKELVRSQTKRRRSEWKYDFYRHANSFSQREPNNMQEFPDNNTKYNTQFLARSLKGTNHKFTQKDVGQFQKPSMSLYSNHYKPILRKNLRHNQTYELRTSLFDKTWVDTKRDRIMDEYRLQAVPFSTQRSNTFITTMRKEESRVWQ